MTAALRIEWRTTVAVKIHVWIVHYHILCPFFPDMSFTSKGIPSWILDCDDFWFAQSICGPNSYKQDTRSLSFTEFGPRMHDKGSQYQRALQSPKWQQISSAIKSYEKNTYQVSNVSTAAPCSGHYIMDLNMIQQVFFMIVSFNAAEYLEKQLTCACDAFEFE